MALTLLTAAWSSHTLALAGLVGLVLVAVGRSTPTTSLIVPSLTGLPRIGPAYSPRPLTRWRFVLGVFPRACVNPPWHNAALAQVLQYGACEVLSADPLSRQLKSAAPVRLGRLCHREEWV